MARWSSWLCLVCCLIVTSPAIAQPPANNSTRWNPVRNLRDKFHPWTPPATLAEWEAASQQLREQAQVAAGLWPFPEKTPLTPVIHGSVDRGDYTVEKVSFASRPGHYVTGNLYRPKGRAGRLPAIASPYGHWAGGRFQDNNDAAIRRDMASGAEQFRAGAQAPLQARMVQLARMGCVGFLFDMVGYGDETALDHKLGFADADAHLRLHGHMGLQTWNSIRVVDFLASLPDVDPTRIGVTGASGGGTQSIVLAALDPRVTVVFPAVSASTNMQGGCVCENACYLRLGVNNIALAALSAPRPLGLTGANDWTVDIETKGLPELKAIYALYGHPELVQAKAFPQFPHNINQPAREEMYAWMHTHLQLAKDVPLKQTDFTPLSRDELTVYNAAHPKPPEALGEKELRALLRTEDERTLTALRERDPAAYRRMLQTAVRVMVQPWSGDVQLSPPQLTNETSSIDVNYGNAGLKLALHRAPSSAGKKVVLWAGRDRTLLGTDPAQQQSPLLQSGWDVVNVYLFLEEQSPQRTAAERLLKSTDLRLLFGYNRPIVSERARDIQAALAALRQLGYEQIVLVGHGEAAVPALLATATAEPGPLQQTIVDLDGFSYQQVSDNADFRMLPGALKYGGLGELAGLATKVQLRIAGVTEKNSAELSRVRGAFGNPVELVTLQPNTLTLADVQKWVIGR